MKSLSKSLREWTDSVTKNLAAHEEAKALVAQHGSIRKAARESGISRETLRYRLALEDMPPGQIEAMEAAKLDPATMRGGWIITDKDGEIIKRSTRWAAPRPEDDVERTVEAIREGLADLPPAQHMPPPDAPESLCAVFPVADLHMGLLTDKDEIGEDWDSKKAALVFQETFGRLVAVTPPASMAILAQLGDLLHVDDQRNITPQSGHQLDADTRYFMILRRAVAVMKWGIEELRRKYPLVIYRGTRGNHDLTAHHAVTVALGEYYHDTPGVQIIDNAGEFYCHEFGRNMVLLHHGDRAKPDRLVHFAAAEWPEVWGRTKHRIALSGHVHHDSRKEIGGMAFESVGTIIPRDVHAYSHAYSARRGLVSITLDREQGEITRARVGL
jgi:hypothetical protein